MTEFKAVIFDFDGVIADTMQDNYLAWKEAFNPYSVTIETLEYFLLEGMGRAQIAKTLSEKHNVDTLYENQIIESKESHYRARNHFRIFDEIPEILKFLSLRNIKIGLVTGASRNRITATLPKEIAFYFQSIVTSDDTDCGKPNPDPYLKAIQNLGLKPNECLVIENALLGIESAKSAGCECFAIETTLDGTYLTNADKIFKNHIQLLSYITNPSFARTMRKKIISIVTPCYNEEENVNEVYEQVKSVFVSLPQYDYEHIFIDNCSKDKTVTLLKEIAIRDKNVKIIVNSRNFGHIRSPYHGLMSAFGDAVISIVADLQDPPHMIKEFLENWEKGYKIVVGIKAHSEESWLFFRIRRLYYSVATQLSDTELLQNFTGFGLYDNKVIDICRKFDDPYPYFRGMICDIGFDMKKIEYLQPLRKRGLTKNNFYTLYDLGMLGITNHSKVPLRLAALTGLSISVISFIIAIVYFIYKIMFWNSFSVGIAPLVIGIFFFGAVQLFFIGILGEYIGSIQTQVLKKPHVIEKERINF